eukprot:2575043-Pyramimonas_sp.AAC.1
MTLLPGQVAEVGGAWPAQPSQARGPRQPEGLLSSRVVILDAVGLAATNPLFTDGEQLHVLSVYLMVGQGIRGRNER